jgi:hypothetical protein
VSLGTLASTITVIRVGDLNGQGAVTTTILHEYGHLLAARSLGFPTGGIHISPTETGASIDIPLSLKTIALAGRSAVMLAQRPLYRWDIVEAPTAPPDSGTCSAGPLPAV